VAQKNVVVIMSDEHDPRIMGCSGHPFVKTPNLDALAQRGVRFTDAYTPSPICVPARAAFATGMRVHQLRLWDNAMPYIGEQRGWGHVLQERGVRVESVGKLHYRGVEDPAGFDVEHLPMHVVGGHGMVWASIRLSRKASRDRLSRPVSSDHVMALRCSRGSESLRRPRRGGRPPCAPRRRRRMSRPGKRVPARPLPPAAHACPALRPRP